jgi:hypothetical protein
MDLIKGYLEKKIICEASPSKMKNRLRMALDVVPDKTLASMVKSSSMCKTKGGKRLTRKLKKKTKKTRKH